MVWFHEADVERKNPIPTSHFLLLDSKAFIHTSNMGYQRIYEDITAIKVSAHFLDGVNFLLLDILRGYDRQDKKDAALLDLAERICTWLGSFEESDLDIQLLNKLQIIRRQRDLNTAETIELGKLIGEDHAPNIRCGAYLLLGENTEAQICFNKLDPKLQTEFLTYPICQFGNLTS